MPDGQHYQFAAGGRNFKTENFIEAVIGATVAEKTGLKVGKTFRPTHDVGAAKGHNHDPFTIVGVLRPTGTPNDRALFVNIEGFYRQAGHLEAMLKGRRAATAADKDDEHEHGHHHEHEAIPDRLKRGHGRAGLSRSRSPRLTRPVAQTINHGAEAQAAVPGDEISQLFEGTIGDVQWVLLLFAVMIVIVAGIGIMVSIYNSMSDRRQEIAVMRALGADRVTIMLVVLLESILLSLGGGVLGLLLGHGVVELLGPLIAERIGMSRQPLAVPRDGAGPYSRADRVGFGGRLSAGGGRLPHRRRPLADGCAMTARPYDPAIAPRGDKPVAGYHALSALAVSSLALGALSALAFVHHSLAVIPLAAIVLGLLALRRIRRAPPGADRHAGGPGRHRPGRRLRDRWRRRGCFIESLREVPIGYEAITYETLQPDKEQSLRVDSREGRRFGRRQEARSSSRAT